MTKFKQFTSQYQVSKTLRFELKPQGKTLEHIQNNQIITHDINDTYKPLKGNDAKRSENYKYAKKVIDEMHRRFIENCFSQLNSVIDKNGDTTKTKLQTIINNIGHSGDLDEYKKDISNVIKELYDRTASQWVSYAQQDFPLIWQENINELQEKLVSCENNQQKKKLNHAIKVIQRKINKGGGALKFVKKGMQALFSNKDTMLLLEWQIWKENIEITGKNVGINNSEECLPKSALINIVRNFDNFHSYFSGFNENRANVYEHKEFISTSIIFRTFGQNLFFHLNNIKSWNTIANSLQKYEQVLSTRNHDFYKKINSVCEYYSCEIQEHMKPNSFVDFMSQSGINRYNRIIGGEPADAGKEKVQGLNEIINLTRQQVQGKRNQFPPLSKLYKQILSQSDGFFIDEFKNDKEMCEAILEFRNHYFIEQIEGLSFIERFSRELKETLIAAADEADNIFISKDKLTKISVELTGSWHAISDWINGCLNGQELKQLNKQKEFSIGQLRDYFNREIEGISFFDKISSDTKTDYTIERQKPLFSLLESKAILLINQIENQWDLLEENGVLNHQTIDKNSNQNSGEKGFEQIAVIKLFLDACISLRQFIALFSYPQKKRPDSAFGDWYRFIDSFTNDLDVFTLYNKCRNYIAKKTFSTEKVKLTFDKVTLLEGWARSKETANLSVLFEKGGQYYLGIINPNNTRIFDYDFSEKDSAKKKELKTRMQEQILNPRDKNTGFEKINYQQIASVAKDIYTLCWDENLGKAIRKTKGREQIWGKEITRIKESKSYQSDVNDRILYFKYLIKCAKSYWKHFELNLKSAESYENISHLFEDIDKQGYKISFDSIKSEYIDEKVENGELYLFQIYNKDFSIKKKKVGKDNLHTSYWKLLFNQQNLQDVVIKLNGQAEIFFRPASIKYSKEKWQKGHHADTLEGKFNYPIIKNKRYAQDKFLFHCPITLNFKSASIPGKFNDKINRFLRQNDEVNVIGIDRGEKHLLYFSVTNQNGEIIEQGSFNTIDTGFIPQGKTHTEPKDYLAKLTNMAGNREQARKSWTKIVNIKEMKAGYLSHVVHKLANLIIKYNAIVVLENLNQGFKRGRFKVEKQVYQKFEKALIDKLNYLVFKDKKDRSQAGHYLNAYQLTNKFVSFDRLTTQTGILFYTSAAYTSTTDPITGYLRNIYRKYQNLPTAQAFWQAFDSIKYNKSNQRFEFTYNRKKLSGASLTTDTNIDQSSGSKTTWTVCSCVQRSRYDKEEGKSKLVDIHEKLVNLFDEKVRYENGQDIRSQLSKINEVSFHKSLFKRFNQILTMRVTDSKHKSGTSENDFIQSPVEPFFDSRKNIQGLPKDGDANGAYNIARKGICILKKIHEWDGQGKSPKLSITKEAWENYCQSDDVVTEQLNKI